MSFLARKSSSSTIVVDLLHSPSTYHNTMSSKKEPLIIWQKWVDPFGEDLDETRWTDYESTSADLVDIDNDESSLKRHSVKVIASPMGLIPYSEHTAAGKIFNFWTGHSNFNISPSIAQAIEGVDGVETLDIFTRYRFRVGIGKCFDEAITMKEISDTAYEVVYNGR